MFFFNRKSLIILLLFLLSCSVRSFCQPQNICSFAAGYENTHIGGNVNFTFHYQPVKSWYVYAGMKYLINDYKIPLLAKTYEDFNSPFAGYRTMYAGNLREHAGLKGGVEKHFQFKNYPNMQWYVFYDLQYTKALYSTLGYVAATAFAPAAVQVYKHGPAVTYEHILGAGITCNLAGNFYYKAFAGLSETYWSIARVDNAPGHFKIYDGALKESGRGKILGVGIGYNLGRNAPKNIHAGKHGDANAYTRHKKEKIPGPFNSLSVEYNNVHSGANFNLTYHHPVAQNWYWVLGGKYLINVPGREPDVYVTSSFKNIGAKHFSDRFGINAGMEKVFPMGRNNNTELYTFLNLQLTRANIQFINYKSIDSLVSNLDYYYHNIESHGPVYLIETYLGMGFRTKLTPKLSMKIFGGVGPVYFTTKKYDANNGTTMDDNNQFTIGRMYGIGLEYRLKMKRKDS